MPDKPTYDVLNLSGGSQSMTPFYIMMYGVFPCPDCAIFADTGVVGIFRMP